jgi:hypothetical protein
MSDLGVVPGLDPGISQRGGGVWIAGSSPAMTGLAAGYPK